MSRSPAAKEKDWARKEARRFDVPVELVNDAKPGMRLQLYIETIRLSA
jgi:hypothetical protein